MTEQDRSHLRTLSILNYVLSALAALAAMFPIVHISIGLLMVFDPEIFQKQNGTAMREAPPAWFGWLFVGIGGFIMAIGLLGALASFLNGRWLARRTHYNFCFVVACLQCLQLPLGTLLGVFTILVLLRPAVKEAFISSGSPFDAVDVR